jgi:hypothetical protein
MKSKRPQTFRQRFNAFFTTEMLIGIICGLISLIIFEWVMSQR